MASDEDFEADKKSKHANMSPAERDAMVEWLGLDREGQKEGQLMQNWRCIYGGAAKGRAMGEEASEVHAAGGYSRLAAFVNQKCKIKSDKRKAWDAEIAEKRWSDLKKKYKTATRMQEPLNTSFDDDEGYEQAKKKFNDEREKVCRDFIKLHAMLKDHPGIHPYQPTDSMSLQQGTGGEDDQDDDAAMLPKSHSMGVKKRTQAEDRQDKKKKKQKMETFHLRKPDAPISAGKQRMNIHQMFLETQQKQVEIDKQKLLVEAIGKLAASNIAPQDMQPYLALMGLSAGPLPMQQTAVVASGSESESGSESGSVRSSKKQ
jgi:hypothetical protein